MNTSQFMDKQIMDLSKSKSSNDFIDLMNPQEEDHIGKKEEIVPSYDFQPIRPIGASQSLNLESDNGGGARVWSSAESKSNTVGIGIRNYSSLDSNDPAKVILEKDHNANSATLMSEIDRTMKKHADNLLHVLEGVSSRLSQLDSRTRHLENSMDDLKTSFGNNHGSTDGRLRQLENILREVQADVHVVKDKQEIVEAQLHLAKLQVSKAEQQPEIQTTIQTDSLQQAASVPQQSYQPPSAASPPNAPPPPSQQNLPPPVQLPNQFPPNQIPSVPQRDPYYHPPGQTPDSTNQQYLIPAHQQLQPPLPAPPQQQYQPPAPPQYSQPPPQPQQHPSLPAVNPSQTQTQTQPQPPLGHHPKEHAYVPPSNYPPSLGQPPPPPSGNPASPPFYGAPSHMFEPPSSRPNSGFSTAYGPSSGTNEPYPYSGPPQYGGGGSPRYSTGGSPSQYGSGSMKQLPPAAAHGGASGYPQLPTARVLPQALPTASAVGGGGGSGSPGTGNRVPIDDVVDKVTNMGFPRDQVRATVRKLTENGQSVDLNVVLDKLMNDSDVQPPRGWFGR